MIQISWQKMYPLLYPDFKNHLSLLMLGLPTWMAIEVQPPNDYNGTMEKKSSPQWIWYDNPAFDKCSSLRFTSNQWIYQPIQKGYTICTERAINKSWSATAWLIWDICIPIMRLATLHCLAPLPATILIKYNYNIELVNLSSSPLPHERKPWWQKVHHQHGHLLSSTHALQQLLEDTLCGFDSTLLHLDQRWMCGPSRCWIGNKRQDHCRFNNGSAMMIARY